MVKVEILPSIHTKCSPKNKWGKGRGMGVNTFYLKWIVLLPKIKILGAFYDLSANQLSQPDSIFWIRTGLAVLVNRQIINGSHYFSIFLDLRQFIWDENRWNPCPPYFFSYFWSYSISVPILNFFKTQDETFKIVTFPK